MTVLTVENNFKMIKYLVENDEKIKHKKYLHNQRCIKCGIKYTYDQMKIMKIENDIIEEYTNIFELENDSDQYTNVLTCFRCHYIIEMHDRKAEYFYYNYLELGNFLVLLVIIVTLIV